MIVRKDLSDRAEQKAWQAYQDAHRAFLREPSSDVALKRLVKTLRAHVHAYALAYKTKEPDISAGL